MPPNRVTSGFLPVRSTTASANGLTAEFVGDCNYVWAVDSRAVAVRNDIR
jgi:hypothetical protein